MGAVPRKHLWDQPPMSTSPSASCSAHARQRQGIDGTVVQQAFDEAIGIAVIAVVGLCAAAYGIDSFLLTTHLIGS